MKVFSESGKLLGKVDAMSQFKPSKRPVMSKDVNLEEVKVCLEGYIDYIVSGEYNSDRGAKYVHAIYEATLIAFYDDDFFDWFNNIVV